MSLNFQENRDVKKENYLKDKPHLIFNVDEKGIQQHYSPPIVNAEKYTHFQEVMTKRPSTILNCDSAAVTEKTLTVGVCWSKDAS